MRSRRVLAWALPFLVLATLQTWMVFQEQIFSPVDELEHTDYVRYVAVEHRLPVYRDEKVSPDLISEYFHQWPRPAVQPWQLWYFPPARFNYEVHQFPVYYIAAAPLYAALAGGDPARPIYALRMLNVAFSELTLLVLILLLRRGLALDPKLAGGIGLAFLAAPGVALRDSQVTNEVLAGLLAGWLLLLLLSRDGRRPRLRAAAEGALFAVAVLTKLTAAALIAPLLFAWALRPGGLRSRALPGAVAALIVWSPWVAWALPTYGSVLPWANRPASYPPTVPFRPPSALSGWLQLAAAYQHQFWQPGEWTTGAHHKLDLLLKVAMAAGDVIVLLGLVAAIAVLVRERRTRDWLAAGVALLALGGVALGYLYQSYSQRSTNPGDARELYMVLGGFVLVVGLFLGRRLPPAAALTGLGGLTAAWLVGAYALLGTGTCIACYPISP